MSKQMIHVSEAEAARDFPSFLEQVGAGAEVVIEHQTGPIAVMHAAEPVRRTIAKSIALAKKQEQEPGRAPVLDPDFADEVTAIVDERKWWNPPNWDEVSTPA